jgi:hypothetical protein
MRKPAHATPKTPPKPPEPVDVEGGIPDRSPDRPAWKHVAIAVIFLAWMGVLIYFLLACGVR